MSVSFCEEVKPSVPFASGKYESYDWNLISAIIITIITIISVHLMNVEQRQASTDPQSSQPSLAVSPPVGCYYLHPPQPFDIIQSESWYTFYRPMEGRRLSAPRDVEWSQFKTQRLKLIILAIVVTCTGLELSYFDRCNTRICSTGACLGDGLGGTGPKNIVVPEYPQNIYVRGKNWSYWTDISTTS